ncbi:MAG: pilus assembly protein MshP [Gammaproteobacteria bacterium]|nr:pilus assembly protein MshP [Gammaproteobacteria bacterium]MBI5617855.1 pilus assembly protein MshP [Gammaproteobacteria bacterium]
MTRRTQRGFSLVTAIFIVVVVSLIAGYMVNLGSSQQAATNFALLGARASFAAESGMEWATRQVVTTDACFTNGTSFALAGGALGGFTVTLSCAETSVTEGAVTYKVFTLGSTATLGTEGAEDYFSRTLSATVANAP